MSSELLEPSPCNLIAEIARSLVDAPEQVEISSVARDAATSLQLRVAPSDVGKIIGKQGRTARSLRTILSAVSMKLHHRYTLEILEEERSEMHVSSVSASPILQ